MLVDLRPFDAELTGKEAQEALDQAGITLNKNTIPDDPRSPFVTSGVRIGTPSVTTQGMREPEMVAIAELIARALRRPGRPGRAGRRPRGRRRALRQVHAVRRLRTAPACPTSPATRSSASSRPSSRWSRRPWSGACRSHFGWVVPPDDRRVHPQPTPAIGGVAMFLGLGAAMGAAWQMDRFSTLFDGTTPSRSACCWPRR